MLDPISDMLTRIRNAQNSGHAEVLFPASKFKESIVGILVKRGFINDADKIEGKSFDTLKLYLKYEREESSNRSKPAISEIKRVSKEGQRVYVDSKGIRKVKNGRGIVIVSTSQGVMSGEDARKKGVGGEIICEVW